MIHANRQRSCPKRKRGTYNPPEPKTIEKALEAMIGGMNLTQAAKQYNIDTMTLKGRLDAFAENGTLDKKKRGPKKKEHFTNEMYTYLCQFVDANSIASHEEIYDNFQSRFQASTNGQHALKTYV